MDKEIPSPYPEFLRMYYSDGPEPDQDIVACCLMYAYIKKEPLPREVIGLLVREFAALHNGHDSELLAKREIETSQGKRIPRSTHPDAEYLERRAVSYIKTCKRTGLDNAPNKSIREAFGVSKTTIKNWEQKYPNVRDDFTEYELREVIEALGPIYPITKKM